MGESKPRIEFWYDFASTYSYLSAMRIDALANSAGVEVVWKPFLLGPIFAAQGWNTSPFNLYPIKGRYMVRDILRVAEERGLTFALPDPFPQNSLLAARVACVGDREGWTPAFSRKLFEAEFAHGQQIADPAVLSSILHSLSVDGERVISAATEPAIKEDLRQRTRAAENMGIFGAPTFVAGRELFWGDDRLEQALRWALR